MKRKWYLTLLGTAYFVICTACCFYYASLYIRPYAGTVPVLQQVLCLGFSVASFLYFAVPRLGHAALTVLTLATLIAIGTSDLGATSFHACVLLLLLIARFSGNNPTANRVPGSS